MKDENERNIDELLKDLDDRTEPLDSWDGLRGRISQRISESADSQDSNTNEHLRSLIFWRKFAIGMAACFVLVSALLFYEHSVNKNPISTAGNPDNLLNQNDVNALMSTFEEVSELFGNSSRWIIVGTGSKSELGLVDEFDTDNGAGKMVAIRLALKNDADQSSQYYDILTYADQITDMPLVLANNKEIHMFITPKFARDGTVSLEMVVQGDGGQKSQAVCAVTNEAFTPVINMKDNGSGFSVFAVGRIINGS